MSKSSYYKKIFNNVLESLTFDEYVYFDCLSDYFTGMTIVATSKNGFQNVINDFSKVSNFEIERISLGDCIITILFMYTNPNIGLRNFTISLLYTECKNSQDLLSEEFLVNMLDTAQCYYDGKRIYYSSKCKESLITHDIHSVVKIRHDNRKEIENLIGKGFNFTIGFWNVNARHLSSHTQFNGDPWELFSVHLNEIRIKFVDISCESLFKQYIPTVEEFNTKLETYVRSENSCLYNYIYITDLDFSSCIFDLEDMFKSKKLNNFVNNFIFKNPITTMPF
jgi:hypothetical protein